MFIFQFPISQHSGSPFFFILFLPSFHFSLLWKHFSLSNTPTLSPGVDIWTSQNDFLSGHSDWARVITKKIQFWEFGQTRWEERSSPETTEKSRAKRYIEIEIKCWWHYLSTWIQPCLKADDHWILDSLHSFFDLSYFKLGFCNLQMKENSD